MSDPSECPDPFHSGESDGEQYEIPMQPGGGWSGVGYRCPTCGFQTVTTTTYIAVPKACVECGLEFMGDPDDDDEVCQECFRKHLVKFFRDRQGGA